MTRRPPDAIAAFNATARGYDLGQPINELLLQAFAAHARREALRDDAGAAIDYATLAGRALAVAALLRSEGVVEGQPVGICVRRSADLVVAIIGATLAGAAYVPLDPDYPTERLRQILEDCANPLVLSRRAERAELGPAMPATTRWLDLDVPRPPPTAAAIDAVRRLRVSPDSPIYILFTSGSTGRPKGAGNSHRGLANRMYWGQDTFALQPGERMLHKTPYSFDLSVAEIFWPLLNGGTLVIAKPGGHRDAHYIAQLIEREQVHYAYFVPSMLRLFLDSGQAARCISLKRVFCAGEMLPGETVRQFAAALPRTALDNLYGPTECAIEVTHWTCGPADHHGHVCIGRPIANTAIHIVDAEGRSLDVGETGELCIGGVQVGLGYYGRDELTRERFVDDPFSEGGRLYRSGDLARWRADGAIECLGRVDQQVKLRGNRIELGEIEARLAEIPGVQLAAVLLHARSGGEPELVACLAPADAPDTATIRSALLRTLPDYMCPERVLRRDALPMLPNGKLDRRALADALAEDDAGIAEPAGGHAADVLLGLWRRLLAKPTLRAEESLFEAGATSLVVLRFLAECRRRGIDGLGVADVYDAPTVAGLVARVAGASGAGSGRAATPIDPAAPVAIVGMAVRAAGADDLEAFWNTLVEGRVQLRRFKPDELDPGVPMALRHSPNYVPVRGVLDGIEGFDASFFGVSDRDATLVDPQQRLLLELAWTAIEHAGLRPSALARIGVFAGTAANTYERALRAAEPELVAAAGDFQVMLANDKDFVASRIAFALNLKGPAVSVHTACSTGLATVAQAVEALQAGRCDAALAGGASVVVPQHAGYLAVEDGMDSASGRCRPFDAGADGTVFASGGAMLVLKRLDDALAAGDTVYAVIRGVGINNDGGGKASFTAPSADGQSAAIAEALARAGFSGDSVDAIEAHGTGTPLGDPIEVAALARHYRREQGPPCVLGSLKGNFGHTIAGAGALGLVKAALSLHRGLLPPVADFSSANPRLPLAEARFEVAAEARPWPRTPQRPRRAAVTSLGVGGTNVHVVLEEAPDREGTDARPQDDGHPPRDATDGATAAVDTLVALPVSARSGGALRQRLLDLATHLERRSPTTPSALLATLVRGREPMPQRRCVVVRGSPVAALRAAAERVDPSARVRRREVAPRFVFLLPGQGAQFPGMAGTLSDELPAFGAALDEALAAVKPWLAIDLGALLRPGPHGADAAAPLAETRHAQPALFCLGYATGRWLIDAGIEPAALIGHSIGEYAAATLAGVMTLDEAARAVCRRAELMWAQPRGSMLAVRAAAADVEALRLPGVEIAGFNAPALITLSGGDADIEAAAARLESAGFGCTRLRVSHGFHSGLMDGALAPFREHMGGLALSVPKRVVYSCRSGEPLRADDARSPDYWARQLREPVRFEPAVRAEAALPGTVFVDLGPGQSLPAWVRQQRDTEGNAPPVVAVHLPAAQGGDAPLQALQALGELWARGADVHWPAPEGARREPLPTYPFQRSRHWFRSASPAAPAPVAAAHSPIDPSATVPPVDSSRSRIPALTARLRSVFATLAGVAETDLSTSEPLLAQGLDSLTLTQATLEIEQQFGHRLRFRRLMEDLGTVERVAAHLDGLLPAEAVAAPMPAPAAGPSIATGHAASPVHGPIPMTAGGGVQTGGDAASPIFGLLAQQMALMQQTLALLGNAPASPVPATTHATASTTAAPTTVPDLKAQPFGASARITLKPQADMDATQSAWLRDFTARYLAKTGRSREYSQQHRDGMADPRVVTGFNPVWKDLVYPIVAEGSDGATVIDIDGNRYIDLLSCFGANLLGYRPKALTEAMHAQLDRGIEVGPQHPLAGVVAAKIRDFTGHERVAFCNTGSEAVMGAMRVARTVTGRKTVAIFTNSYHGIFDEVIVRGTPMLRSLAAAPGILANAVENILVLDYGSDEALRVLRERGRELAAIMIEPVQNKLPTFHPGGFVRALRDIADASGCALIFDEVVTGFRLGAGGAQAFYGVRADLCTYGKIIGGGLPLAVIAGASKWMDALDGGTWRYGDDSYPEAGVTYFAGTFVRHPLALAAANATLDVLAERGPALYATLAARTQALVDRLNDGFRARGAPVEAVHCASLWRLRWDDGERYVSLFYYLARFHGLHLYEQFGHFVTDAMDDTVIQRIGDVFLASLDELMALGLIRPRDGIAPPTIKPPAVDTPAIDAPLTPGQTERWLAAQVCDEALLALNETLSLELDGPLDDAAFRAAIGDLQRRHDAFRTVISADAPRQRVVPGSEWPLAVIDLSTRPDRDAALREAIAHASRERFPLGERPMLRLHLFRLDASRHVLHVVCSHLVFDGWASSVLLDELAALYAARREGRIATLPPPGHPGEFAAAEQSRMAGAEGQADAAWWKAALASTPAALSLGDREAPVRRSYAADTATWRIDGARFAALQGVAKAHRLTLFQLLLGVVARLAARAAKQSDLVLSIPYASQNLGRHPALIADGVLDLPLRLRIDAGSDAVATAVGARAALMDALEHPLMTQGTAARLLGLPSRGERPPLTGVYFNLNPKLALDGFAPLRAVAREARKPGLLGELMFNFYDEGDALSLDLHHATEFFSPQRIDELLAAFEHEVDTVVGTADALAAGHAAQQAPTAPIQAAAPRVESLFAAQVARSPQRIALTAGDERWTYAQLEARANRIARSLAARGVRRGDWVGLCLPRSPDLVAALLGVLKCGAAYVPLDPAFPLQRLRDMAEDAGLKLLLSDAENAERLAIADLPTLRLDADAAAIDAEAATPLPPVDGLDAPAYVIYTSGSTGKPKGVVVPHGGVVNFLRSMAHTPGLGADDRLLAVTTLSFDIAVLELLLPLAVGAEIVLAQRTDAIDGEALKQLIARRDVTLMQATPSTWHLLLEAGFIAPRGFRALCGGEALSPALATRLLESGVAALWNMYGPTETTVWSTCARITDPESISVGGPIDATVIRILDEANRECGVGEAGEICIGGAGVAQGYHARPELTAERFIADPLDATPGARLYRTGDLGAWNADGTIRHMGRLDHQVKLRGYRIELGEIEAALERLPSIARAAMRVENFGPMDDRLVAYVAAAPGAEVPKLAALRRELGQRLPEYMLPQVLNVLAELPLLPNGKIDRKSLGNAGAAEPTQAAALGGATGAAATPSMANTVPDAAGGADASLVATLGERMGELLKRAPLGADEHFFEAGGHSLLAAELAGAVQQRLGQRPTLRTIFEAPTPARLAAALRAARPGASVAPSAASPALSRAPRGHASPLSVQQLRAWFVEQTSADPAVNLLPSAHRLRGPLDETAFRRALDALVRRQGSLRSVFQPSADGVAQRLLDRIDIDCPLVDLSTMERVAAESLIVAEVAALQATPIDLQVGPPFRTALFRLGSDEHVFVFVVHHLVWDGWSFDVLYHDMAALYAQETGQGAAPPALALDYVDYAAWQQSVLASGALGPQVEHWRARLLPLPAPLSLPADRPRPATLSGRGASFRRHLPNDVVAGLHGLAQRRGTTLFIALLAIYVAMLRRLSGQSDVVVGTPVRGREQPELLPLMGFFVNALPLRFAAVPTDIRGALSAAQATVAEALGAPDVPIEALVRELQLPRDPSRPVLFQTMFSFQDARDRVQRWGDLEHSRFAVPVTGASHELIVSCVETPAGLEMIFNYATDLFDAARVEEWADQYGHALRRLVAIADDAPLATLWDGSSATPATASTSTPTPTPMPLPPTAPAPTPAASTTTDTSEALLRRIWSELLGQADITREDNFFDRGGHSLLALTMVSRVELACGKRLPLLRVGDSSLGALARMLDEDAPAPAPVAPAANAKGLGGWLKRLVGQTEA